MSPSKYLIVLYLFLSISFCINPFLHADTLVLAGGKEIKCIVKSEDKQVVEIEMYVNGRPMALKYGRNMVDKIIRNEAENQAMRKAYDAERENMISYERRRILEDAIDSDVIERRADEQKKKREREAALEKARLAALEEAKREDERKKKREDTAFRIEDITTYTKYDDVRGGARIHYKGLFYNDGMARKKDVLITMVFYDSEMQELVKKIAYTSPIIVEPKKSATFEIEIDAELPVKDYKVSAEWKY